MLKRSLAGVRGVQSLLGRRWDQSRVLRGCLTSGLPACNTRRHQTQIACVRVMRRGDRGYLVVLIGCPVAVHPNAALYFSKRTFATRRFSRYRSLVKWLPFVLDHTLSRIKILIILVIHYLIYSSLVNIIVNSTAHHHILDPIVIIIIYFSITTHYSCSLLSFSFPSSWCRRFAFIFILSSLVTIVANMMIFDCLKFFSRGQRRGSVVYFATIQLSLLSRLHLLLLFSCFFASTIVPTACCNTLIIIMTLVEVFLLVTEIIIVYFYSLHIRFPNQQSIRIKLISSFWFTRGRNCRALDIHRSLLMPLVCQEIIIRFLWEIGMDHIDRGNRRCLLITFIIFYKSGDLARG